MSTWTCDNGAHTIDWGFWTCDGWMAGYTQPTQSRAPYSTLRVPKDWDASWFRKFCTDVLAKADVRNAVANGLTIAVDGNSVAEISADTSFATIRSEVVAHEAESDPHPVYLMADDAMLSVAMFARR